MMRRSERGFVLVLVAMSSLVLLLLIGFVVDVGAWYLQALKLQRAADAAALAGSAALPDVNEARADANASYSRNGLQDGVANIRITTDVSSERIQTTAQNTSAPTYFTSLLGQRFSISRVSAANRPMLAPSLGSPYNVLGTGNLSVPGVRAQNFWLAVNGGCSPKEDGDYFSARYDKTKGPFLSTFVPGTKNYQSASDGRHQCPSTPDKANPDFSAAGYSYYVNVPKPPTAGGTVDVKIYDPGFNSDVNNTDVDKTIGLTADTTYSWFSTGYALWNIHGTVGDQSDDTLVGMPHPYMVDSWDNRATSHEWWKLATIPYSEIANGGQFRVQVFAQADWETSEMRGVNAFSIGAFASWNPAMEGCDTRIDITCPRVYGRNAISVYNNLAPRDASGNVDFFFADIDGGSVGKRFKVMLWDAAEGVNQLQLIAPDGTPLHFDWTATPDAGLSETNVNFIDTSRLDSPARANLSNPFTFNDRLITISVTIPSDYPAMVDRAGGDTWMRVRYKVDAAPSDRTTWGIAMDTGGSGPAHLVRP